MMREAIDSSLNHFSNKTSKSIMVTVKIRNNVALKADEIIVCK